MKTHRILFILTLASFIFFACKNKEQKVEQANFAISGMTCEIGCAKIIASKLSKKEGILEANVIFKDSTAVVKFDANKTNKKDLIALIDGIADGKTWSVGSCRLDDLAPDLTIRPPD